MTKEQLANRRHRLRAVKEEQARIRRSALLRIRHEIGQIVARRRELLSRVRVACKAAARRVRERVKVLRAEARARIAREVAEIRQAERNRCQLRRYRVKRDAETAIQRKRRELREELDAQRLTRRVETHRRRELAKHAARERRQESDDEVRSNIAPDLVPIFDAVRSKIRGGPGISRTEAFVHWVEEHEGEVWRLHDKLAEAKHRALLREEERAAREAKKAERAARALGGRVPKPDDDVPF